MRNHLEILNDIDKLLADNSFEVERKQIESEIRASATAIELCLRSGSILLKLQNKNKRFSTIAGNLIKEFISYCHVNGLYPKPNYEN